MPRFARGQTAAATVAAPLDARFHGRRPGRASPTRTNDREEVAMSDTALQGKKIAFLVAQEGVEQVELTEPWDAVERAGGTPELLAPEPGEVQAFNHLDKGDRFAVDKALEQARASDYDGVVLPGGVANPDQLRTKQRAVSFLQ